MKTILIKEIDQLTSKLHKNKIVSEYLIYLMENDVKLECYSELGKENRDLRINDIILVNFDLKIDVNDIIKEVNFEEFKNQ